MTAARLFALLLPQGVAKRTVVLGSRLDSVSEYADTRSAESEADMVLLAPTSREARQDEWLAVAIERTAEVLAPGGTVYAIVPRGTRRRLRLTLQKADFVVGTPLALLPSLDAIRYAVPLEPEAWEYMVDRVATARGRLWRATGIVLRARLTRRALAVTLRDVAYIAHAPGNQPPMGWIGSLVGGPPPDTALLQTSWRGPYGSVVMNCFHTAANNPSLIVKVTDHDSHEKQRLLELSQTAQAAGARVPRLIATAELDGSHQALIETLVTGISAAEVVARSPHRLLDIIESLATWLERWSRLTVAPCEIGTDELRERILGRADDVLAHIEEGEEYRKWLEEQCALTAIDKIPLVTAHNDLTMWNVLLDAGQGVGILDWEDATSGQLPLVDFYYAVTDATAACNRYASRVEAVDTCFGGAGSFSGVVARLQNRLAEAADVTPRLAGLSFHACWLDHAANELRSGTGQRPFLDVVRWSSTHGRREIV